MILPPKRVMQPGISFDRTASEGYREKIKDGKMPPLSFLEDYLVEDHRMRREEINWGEEKPEANEKEGLELVKVLREEAASNVQPVEVQKRIEVGFKDRDWSFLGILDLLCVDEAAPDNLMILDHKVSAKKPSGEMAMTSPQLTCYAGLFQQEVGSIPPVALEYFVRPQKTNPARNFREFGTRDQAQIDRWWRDTDSTIRQIETAVETNNFPPCPPTVFGQPNRTCSPEQCGYYTICREEF